MMICLEDGSSSTGRRGRAQETHLKGVCKNNLSTADSCNASSDFIFSDGVLGISVRLQSLEALTRFSRAGPLGKGKRRREKDVSLASRANEVITTVVPSPIKKSRKPTISAWSTAILVGSSLLFLMTPPCDATVLYKETEQKLSKECLNKLMYACPDEKQVSALGLQKLCCNSSHSLKFHCQHYEENGNDVLFPACVPKETCKPGFACRIVQGSDGSPQIIQEPCENGHFESENRSSVSQVYPYCTESHTQCPHEGQTVFCQGDDISDTRCVCYFRQDHTECDKAFTQHSTCWRDCNSSDTNITYCPALKHSNCSKLSPEQFLINRTICPKPTNHPEPNELPKKVTENSTAFSTTSTNSTAFGKTEQRATTAPPPAEMNESTVMPPWLIAVITVGLISIAVTLTRIFWARIKTVLARIRDNICAHAAYKIPPDQAHSQSQV